jgi:threonine/homoserine/homoserine lactone efflux protein
VGLAYMLVLAWRLARSAGGLAQADGARLEVGFAQGVALQFVNIKAWMNALMISAGWVTVDGQVAQRLAIVLPLMMAYGLASNLTYALVGSGLRRWLARGAGCSSSTVRSRSCWLPPPPGWPSCDAGCAPG